MVKIGFSPPQAFQAGLEELITTGSASLLGAMHQRAEIALMTPLFGLYFPGFPRRYQESTKTSCFPKICKKFVQVIQIQMFGKVTHHIKAVMPCFFSLPASPQKRL
jgi:hypothetical protein